MATKNLMIVESPAKAKTIEKYLGKDFTVKASFGHVRDLPKGNKAIDIENGFEPEYIVIPDKKDVISDLKKLAKGAEVVWLATDEDREGEAISWHLAEVLGLDIKKAKRVVFNEITKKAIQNAVDKPRLIDINLVNAQQARRVLDRLVGFQISPILWTKIRTGLSAGRVQSVAVRLIVQREREIMAHESTSAYKVTAQFLLYDGNKINADLNTRFPDLDSAKAFLTNCVGANYSISALEKKPGKKSPAAPFTTSTLQQEASRKLSFSVAQTMRVAQGLYESGKITYMRTDSVSLSQDAMTNAQEVITQMYGKEYHQLRQYTGKVKNAQEAHEAIRPTEMSNSSVTGDRNEVRLYDLIWKRTVASQMADAKLEKTVVTIDISTDKKNNFIATGEVLLFDGFLKVYMESKDDEGEDEEAEGVLPPMKQGQKLKLKEIEARERFTKYPPRYTEASLVKKLEELGIGRPSTFAPTISTIQRREYVVKENRDGTPRNYNVIHFDGKNSKVTVETENTGAEKSKLFPSDLGMLVTEFLIENFPKILDYGFTATVEEEFDEIANGKVVWNNMIGKFYKDFSVKVANTKENAERVSGERILGKDPKTGRDVKVRLGRFGPIVQIDAASEEEKPQYASLRNTQRLDTITFEEAMELFKMPRILGEMDGEQLRANIGRFGPYIQKGKIYASVPKDEDVFEITYERAVELMKAKLEAEANKLIKEIAEDIQVLRGRYGPYVKMRDKNLRIPKDQAPEKIDLAMCEKWYSEQEGRPTRGKKSAAKTKTLTKKAAKKAPVKSAAKTIKKAAKKSVKKSTTKKAAPKKAAAKKTAVKKAAPKKAAKKAAKKK